MRGRIGIADRSLQATSQAMEAISAPIVRRRLARILSLDDFAEAARRRLPASLFGFVSGGAETNASLIDNRAAFAEIGLIPRVLRDVSSRSQEVELFGDTYAAPFGIAPMGTGALFAYRADIRLAAAAAASRLPMIVSGASLIRMEDVAPANPGAWFQAYVPGEPELIAGVVERVRRAGYGTLVLTADVPVGGNRENNVRAGFTSPLRLTPKLVLDGLGHPAWLLGTALRTLALHGMPHFENSYRGRGEPILSRRATRNFGARDRLTWDHLALIRSLWPGRLIVKGILSAPDARMARDRGVDGLIVSNHGGRQLDGAVSPLRVLPDVVAAAGDLPVMLDGGVRRGTDILKALALGARMVFVGRPFLYALVAAGDLGIEHAIRILSDEVDRNLALLGLTSPSDMSADFILRTHRT